VLPAAALCTGGDLQRRIDALPGARSGRLRFFRRLEPMA